MKRKRKLKPIDAPGTRCETVIAVDPGDDPGFAVARRQQDGTTWDIVAYGAIDKRKVMDVLVTYNSPGEVLLVIEDQYLGFARSIKGLIRRAQDWACCGRLLGYRVSRVYPNQWISRAVGSEGAVATRDRRKEMAKQRVDELGQDSDAVSQDACDALCILLAVLHEYRIRCLNPSIFRRSSRKRG